MGVVDPLPVIIENYPPDQTEWMLAQNHPKRPELGTREVPFSRTIYIERSDFLENPPKKFFRLSPGSEVRLRYAYLVTCTEVVRDSAGNVTAVKCRYDPDSRGGISPDGRKVRGTIHWVCQKHAARSQIRIYDRLFTVANPASMKDSGFSAIVNPDSLTTVEGAYIEAEAANSKKGSRFQFERNGYYYLTRPASGAEPPIFHKIVSLRDTWKKIRK